MKAKVALAVAFMAGAAAGVGRLQPRLAGTVHEIKERDDIVAFPPPAELHISVLGWDAAAIDILWSTLLVQYGEHFSERREFTEIPRYVDAILELDPKFWPLYKYVDTMLAYRPLQGTESDVRLARGYLERATHELPESADAWLKLGQFVAFVAPSFLTNDADKEAWRKDGAEAMARAAELGADEDETLAAASMLTRAGSTREAIRYLENAYAFTEHPAMREIHETIGKRLEALASVSRRDAADAAAHAVAARWMRELPSVSRTQYLLLGPVTDAARCAGFAAARERACARPWDVAVAEPGPSVGQ